MNFFKPDKKGRKKKLIDLSLGIGFAGDLLGLRTKTKIECFQIIEYYGYLIMALNWWNN